MAGLDSSLVCHFLVVLFPSQASWVVSAPVISALSPWIQADAQLSQPGQVLVLQVLEVLKGEVRSFMKTPFVCPILLTVNSC